MNVPFWLMSGNEFAANAPPVESVICWNEFAWWPLFAFSRHKKISPFPSVLSQFSHDGFGCTAPVGVKPLPSAPSSNVASAWSAAFDVNAIMSPFASIVAFWLFPLDVVVT